jgi:hypothetical protein
MGQGVRGLERAVPAAYFSRICEATAGAHDRKVLQLLDPSQGAHSTWDVGEPKFATRQEHVKTMHNPPL